MKIVKNTSFLIFFEENPSFFAHGFSVFLGQFTLGQLGQLP